MSFLVVTLLVAGMTFTTAAFAGSSFPAIRAIRLLNGGRYGEAERYLKGVLATTHRVEARYAARYNLAVALHRQGRFEESLDELGQLPLHALDAALHGAANALYAWNLLFLRRDLNQAEACIRASGPLFQRATTQFALVYLWLLQGRRQEADALFFRLMSIPPDRRSVVGGGEGSALVIDHEFEQVIEEHLLGLCAQERGEILLARQHFENVVRRGHPSFYTRHASARLGQTAPLLPAPWAA